MNQFLRRTLIATSIAGAMTLGGTALAQDKPAAAAPKANAAPAAAAHAAAPATGSNSAIDAKFKTEKDKFGYYVGSRIAQSLSQVKDEVDVPTVIATVQNSLKGAKPLLTDAELQVVAQEFSQKMQSAQAGKMAEEAKKNGVEGEAYLAKNKAKPGVTTTASGLQYEVIKQGSGAHPKATDNVKVEYVGTKIDGTKFDASADHGGPATFPLNQVVPGWTEGVQLMGVGAEYKFTVPAKLGYGEHGPPQIGPNAVLVFDVTLVGIEPPTPAAAAPAATPAAQ